MLIPQKQSSRFIVIGGIFSILFYIIFVMSPRKTEIENNQTEIGDIRPEHPTQTPKISQQRDLAHSHLVSGSFVEIDRSPLKPSGTFSQLTSKLKKYLNDHIKVDAVDNRDTKEKELIIKTVLKKNDITEISNDEIKQMIIDVLSAFRDVNYQDYDLVQLRITCTCHANDRPGSETEIISVSYKSQLVRALPWHEVDHLLWYGFSEKININPALKSVLIDH